MMNKVFRCTFLHALAHPLFRHVLMISDCVSRCSIKNSQIHFQWMSYKHLLMQEFMNEAVMKHLLLVN